MRRSGVRIPSAPQNEEGPDTFFVRSFIVLWMCMGGFGRRSEARARTAPLSSTRRKPRLTSGNAESQAGFFLCHSDPASLRVPAPMPLSVPLGQPGSQSHRAAAGGRHPQHRIRKACGGPAATKENTATSAVVAHHPSLQCGHGPRSGCLPGSCQLQRGTTSARRSEPMVSWRRDARTGEAVRGAGVGPTALAGAVSVWPPWDESER